MPSAAKRGILIGIPLAAALLVFFLLGASKGGAEQVHGVRAGNLDAGSIVSARYPLRRGESLTVGFVYLRNVGRSPILVESIQPQSTAASLRATPGRIWIIPRDAHLSLPISTPGWPPKHLPTKPPPSAPKSWVQPHPDVLSLPTSRMLFPGRQAQLLYGILLHANPSTSTRISALRIKFEEAGRSYVWTLPDSVALHKPH